MNRVFFVDVNGTPGCGVLTRIEKLCRTAGLEEIISERDLVAVKLHFGELGNTRMLRPQFVRVISDLIRKKSGQPFLTDCNTLFTRNRYNAVCHLETAGFNGFNQSMVNAPIIVADGLRGLDYRLVKAADGLETVKVGSAIYDADKLVVVTHFKGHDDVGFGGIIKNLGMGAIARSGKQKIHSHVKPVIDRSLCNGCGLCEKNCPQSAITSKGTSENTIDLQRCDNCGNCLVVCPCQAIPIQWERDDLDIQRKLVESCAAVLSNKKNRCFFISFLVDVTAFCDCRSWSPVPLVGDIGILAGTDPVAVEQASVDLVERMIKEKYGDKTLSDLVGIDGFHQLKYAEELGLGSRNYRLEMIE